MKRLWHCNRTPPQGDIDIFWGGILEILRKKFPDCTISGDFFTYRHVTIGGEERVEIFLTCEGDVHVNSFWRYAKPMRLNPESKRFPSMLVKQVKELHDEWPESEAKFDEICKKFGIK